MSETDSSKTSFGIMTAPMQVTYADLARVWRAADAQPLIEHAWVFDHLMPIGGDPDRPILEGWTLLSALAAQTSRLRLGTMVTSNRFRPPALLAKMAATVDQVSGGRLDFGIGVGSLPGHPLALREYTGYGLPYLATADAVAAFAESLEVITRLWSSDQPFDFDGEYVELTGAFVNPKPVQRPRPPILVGGRSTRTLRIAARYADIWNLPGGTVAQIAERGRVLDGLCEQIGRDPATITRSIGIGVYYDDAAGTRDRVAAAIDAGIGHIVLSLTPPYPADVVEWLVAEVVQPVR